MFDKIEWQRKQRKRKPHQTREYRVKHWHNNTKPKWLRRRYWLDKYKVAKGCSRCSYNEEAVALDFDHILGEKKFNIGSALSNRKLQLIFAEIRKCKILCANCHRIETRDRK